MIDQQKALVEELQKMRMILATFATVQIALTAAVVFLMAKILVR